MEGLRSKLSDSLASGNFSSSFCGLILYNNKALHFSIEFYFYPMTWLVNTSRMTLGNTKQLDYCVVWANPTVLLIFNYMTPTGQTACNYF